MKIINILIEYKNAKSQKLICYEKTEKEVARMSQLGLVNFPNPDIGPIYKESNIFEETSY